MPEMKFNGVDMVEVPFWSELEDEGLNLQGSYWVKTWNTGVSLT